ncbi:hypothetical protein GWK48_09605 [Metallosphaera tengchongensis]|uniref:Uncharacterized protein n=1 Tax=Metallosphaera tengchongensis TaxID=1532350 RepID=A0A6N0P021_9CREN|nr:hypothetical protein GWK48_09605 [Metallosphaera tengchongensis]
MDGGLLKKRYEEYEVNLRTSKIKDLMLVIRDFMEFIKSLKGAVYSEWLKRNLLEQERIAKKILTVLKVRYFLIFLYRRIVDGLVYKLINSIRSFLSQLPIK